MKLRKYQIFFYTSWCIYFCGIQILAELGAISSSLINVYANIYDSNEVC